MLQHLRQQGEERIAQLWQEAKAKGTALRAEAARHLARHREQKAAESTARLDRFARLALLEAKRQGERRKNAGHRQLADRLLALAWPNLATLRGEEYARTFALLVAELPDHQWREATVHPDDRELAAAALPQATIRADQGISGGLTVSTAAGRVRIVNTFEKRLERAWPELLPGLLRDLLQEADDDRPSP